MSDISELERRLTAALDRISNGLENAQSAASAEDTAKVAELSAENAKLTEDLKISQERAARLSDRLESAESENARQEAVIEALREHCDALSAANTAGQNAGDAINTAMAAELSDLRAVRKSDLAQMDEILAELAPAVKEA